MNIVERARVFATAAHAAVGQVRKYTFEPYIVHPAEVAGIVASVPHTREMLAAAWLHDVVEDTSITHEMIALEFGTEVSELVKWLTNIADPNAGNRAIRVDIECEHVSHAPPDAKTIKLADLIANSKSIKASDEKFAKVYLAEKRLFLKVLAEGDPALLELAHKIVGE